MNDFHGVTITNVQITLVDDPGHGALKAYASLELNGFFAVKGVRIIRAEDGRMFLSMPNKRLPDGGFRDQFFPTTQPGRRWLEDAVIAAYAAELRRVGDGMLASLKAAG